MLTQKTCGKRIIECTKDPVWGCGMPLKDDDCLNSTKWTSQGIMGEMLEEIRDDLKAVLQTSTNLGETSVQESSTTDPNDTSSSSSSDSSDNEDNESDMKI